MFYLCASLFISILVVYRGCLVKIVVSSHDRHISSQPSRRTHDRHTTKNSKKNKVMIKIKVKYIVFSHIWLFLFHYNFYITYIYNWKVGNMNNTVYFPFQVQT